MKRALLVLAVAATSTTAQAAPRSDPLDLQGWWWAPHPTPREASVADVSRLKAPVLVDVNGKQTRASEGVIPGAVLLTSSSQYDLKELPAQKSSQLVFYCANEWCNAAHQAALRAIEAGYMNVSVLRSGLRGWKAAGQKVAPST